MSVRRADTWGALPGTTLHMTYAPQCTSSGISVSPPNATGFLSAFMHEGSFGTLVQFGHSGANESTRYIRDIFSVLSVTAEKGLDSGFRQSGVSRWVIEWDWLRMANHCPKCGATLKEQEKFCSLCGTLVETSSEEERAPEVATVFFYRQEERQYAGARSGRACPSGRCRGGCVCVHEAGEYPVFLRIEVPVVYLELHGTQL